MEKARNELWLLSVDAWKDSAQVTGFLEHEIGGLRDANGDPLPDEVKQFLLDLIFLRVKPRRGRFLPKRLIREMYRQVLFLEQQLPSDVRPHGVSPSDQVKNEMAKKLNTSVAVIDQILSPRKSRQRRIPRK